MWVEKRKKTYTSFYIVVIVFVRAKANIGKNAFARPLSTQPCLSNLVIRLFYIANRNKQIKTELPRCFLFPIIIQSFTRDSFKHNFCGQVNQVRKHLILYCVLVIIEMSTCYNVRIKPKPAIHPCWRVRMNIYCYIHCRGISNTKIYKLLVLRKDGISEQ